MRALISICITLMLCSCSSDFLKIYPETNLNEGNFYQSDNEFVLVTNGAYLPLRDMEKRTHWLVSELKSDNMGFQKSSIAGDFTTERIDPFLSSADIIAYNDFWDFSFRGIYNCNKAIQELENRTHTWEKPELKNRSIGEAYFLRALYYFNLVRQFGGVPLVTKPITGKDAVNIKRSTDQEIYNLIISDLKVAQENLAKATNVEEAGRANESAAYGLLGKVYLTLKNYKDAETALRKVIDLGKHSLLPDYRNVFNPSAKDFKETIFSVQYSENTAELSNNFIFFNAPYTSKGEVTNRPNVTLPIAGSLRPTQDLLDAFEPGDLRKGVAIKFWRGPDWNNTVYDIPYCAKYQPPRTATLGWSGDNFPVLRYADVLLMYAEALNQQGRTSEALTYVRMVRSRAGLTTAASFSQRELDLLIEKERQVELCFENQRWYDLVRRDRVLEVMTAHGIRERKLKPFLGENSFQIEAYKILAPIPAEQILINKLEQNPGY